MPPELPPLPLPARIVNTVGPIFRALGSDVGRLEPAFLQGCARRNTGLADFGDDTYVAPLERLCASYEEAGLSFLGRMIAGMESVQFLMDRLRLRAMFAADPGLAGTPVQKPLVILGLPRTGTTLLQRMLALDPAARSLPLWVLMDPLPPPDAATMAAGGGKRLVEAEKKFTVVKWAWPDVDVKHELHPRLPEEEMALLGSSFVGFNFWVRFPCYSYAEWLFDQDGRGAYAHYRRFLQALQSTMPGAHWVLKSPGHMLFADALAEAVPEACFLMTHRDPVEVVPSFHSLFHTFHGGMSTRPDLDRMVAINQRMLAEGLDRALALRARAGERVLDVPYDTLVRDPVAMARRVYAHFELPWPEGHDARLAAWLAQNGKDKKGAHRYALADWGLTEADVRARFAHYRLWAAEAA